MPDDKLIEAGWQSLYNEVLSQGWPESPELKLLIEVTFFSGAVWIMHVLRDEGTAPAVLKKIDDELHEHLEQFRERRNNMSPADKRN